MSQAVDRFFSETARRFSGINELNETFNFSNPHTLLQGDNNDVDVIKFETMFADEVDLSKLPLEIERFKTMFADEVDLSKLPLEIERFKWLVKSSGSTFQSNATALDVLQWLTER